MTKALGMIVYIKTASTTVTTYSTACAISVSGGGVEAAAVEIEPCLSDTVVLDGPGDPKYKPVTVRYKKEFSTAATLSTTIEGFVTNKTLVKLAVKYPTATAVYSIQDCYVVDHDNDESDRNQDLTATMTLIPQTAASFSTTAPATA
jgi:hypothetical protein